MSTFDTEGTEGTDLAHSIQPDGSRSRFVMVPVPEEFEEEVSRLILQAVMAPRIKKWDDHLVRRLRAALDDRSWALVGAVARAEEPLGEDALAREIGVSPEEVRALRNQVTAGSTTVEHFDLIVDREGGGPPWSIRAGALPAVMTVLEEHPPTTGD